MRVKERKWIGIHFVKLTHEMSVGNAVLQQVRHLPPLHYHYDRFLRSTQCIFVCCTQMHNMVFLSCPCFHTGRKVFPRNSVHPIWPLSIIFIFNYWPIETKGCSIQSFFQINDANTFPKCIADQYGMVFI